MTQDFDDDWTDIGNETISGGSKATTSWSDYASEAQQAKVRWLLETPEETIAAELASHVRTLLPPDLRVACFYQASCAFWREKWLDGAPLDPMISTASVVAKMHDAQSLARKQIQEDHFREFMAKPERELVDEAIAFVLDRVRWDAPAWVVWSMLHRLERTRPPLSFDFLPNDFPADAIAKARKVNLLARRKLRDRLLDREREMLPGLVEDYGRWAQHAYVPGVTPESVASFISVRGLRLAPETRGQFFDRLAFVPK